MQNNILENIINKKLKKQNYLKNPYQKKLLKKIYLKIKILILKNKIEKNIQNDKISIIAEIKKVPICWGNN